jgi:hypothetical protein
MPDPADPGTTVSTRGKGTPPEPAAEIEVVHGRPLDPVVDITDPDERLDLFDPRIDHRVVQIERGPFTVAVCRGCGWESIARRSRPLARSEGTDHEVLFAGPAPG